MRPRGRPSILHKRSLEAAKEDYTAIHLRARANRRIKVYQKAGSDKLLDPQSPSLRCSLIIGQKEGGEDIYFFSSSKITEAEAKPEPRRTRPPIAAASSIPDPEVVVKNMLPAFQAPAQFNLPLDGPKFKSGGLYDPWCRNLL
jgi:hypothetical protein